ncbi:MAG: biotin transporter BioY [Brevundimonas sp.]|nr:MAG: biotin transporter BioY [Brevundimonas sp.]
MFRTWLLIPAFALLTAFGAQVSVPMTPVPMTLQSLAVVAAGLVLGWRGGAAAMGLYLLLGAVGLPVFSDGGAGLDALTGPTSGYLWSFPFAAAIAGLAPSTKDWRGIALALAAALLAHALILGLGAAWLAQSTGWSEAFTFGVAPFLIGAVVKSAVAVAVCAALHRFRRA